MQLTPHHACSAAGCPGKHRQGAWEEHLITNIHGGSIFCNELQIFHEELFSWTAGQPADQHKIPAMSKSQAKENPSPFERAMKSSLQAHATHACCVRKDHNLADSVSAEHEVSAMCLESTLSMRLLCGTHPAMCSRCFAASVVL